MASQKQIDANRINARKSTGPKTPEGKAVARRNRLTHGLRAEEHVLPGEDPAEFRRFVDAWIDDWKPTTMARLELVEEAATAAWRRKRCRRVETARIARRLRGARNRHHRDEDARLDAAMVGFFDDPQPALDAHLRSREGVDRLVAMWSEIERASRSIDTWTEHEVHHFTLIALRGHCPADPPAIELRDASWGLYLRNVPEDRIDDAEPIDDDEAALAADWIHRLAVHYLEWLAEVRADLPDAMREAEAQAFEPKPEDAAVLRYEGMLSREFHRSLGSLVKLTKSGDDLVECECEAPNEPNLSTESCVGAGVAADPEFAETDAEFHRSPGSLTQSGDDLVESEADAPNEPNLSTESFDGEGVAVDTEIAETEAEEPHDAAESSIAPTRPVRPRRIRRPRAGENHRTPEVQSVRAGGEACAPRAPSDGERMSPPPA